MEIWIVRAWRLALLAALVVVWEVASRLHWVDPDLLPPLSSIFAMLGTLLRDAAFRSDILVTVVECLTAFVIVVPLGLISGFALGESKRLEKMFGLPLQLLMTVPKSIFLPVFILAFGIGFAEKVIFAVVLTYFIVVPTGIAAVHSVPSGLLLAARSFGATRAQIYARIYLPAVAPIILSGVRLGLIFSVHGIIFAEMYASSEGIGRKILDWGESFDMKRLFAGVLLILVATVILNETMQALEGWLRTRTRFDSKS
ncbi:MAG TPA: ABC transporter permease subunit [Xanthobacteraceae bacterium]|jgi:ABC-type nitrate/sulfonate/bicarbonate transport system permease component|nr:ABC transporter permease subunit [Xanthobacteraceae bacterium]